MDAYLRKGQLTFQKWVNLKLNLWLLNDYLCINDLNYNLLNRTDTAEKIQVNADLTIGADGAFSAVRKAMMKQPLFDFNQKYIEHGYIELCIPADDNGSVSLTYSIFSFSLIFPQE